MRTLVMKVVVLVAFLISF